MEELTSCPLCNANTFKVKLESRDYFLTKQQFRIVTCSNCSLSFTNPRPEITELQKYYKSDNYISHSNKANNLTNLLYKLVRSFTLWQKYKLISRSLENPSHVDHLDYGCGTGHFINYTNSKGWNSIGYEPDSSAIKNNNQLIFNDISKISKDHTFDVITLFHVLEHVSELNETLHLLISKLKPNGTLLLALPNHKSADAIHYAEYWAGYDLPRHLYHFSQESIDQLSIKHGIKIERTVPMFFDSFYVSILSEKYRNSNFAFLKGIFNGMRSNMKARNGMEYSSLVYLLKR
uniref:methyltransferase domain-containing protein n=1 Tax=Roseivirga sp. TaxID=1964215 RepID=UPI004047E5E9